MEGENRARPDPNGAGCEYRLEWPPTAVVEACATTAASAAAATGCRRLVVCCWRAVRGVAALRRRRFGCRFVFHGKFLGEYERVSRVCVSQCRRYSVAFGHTM